VKQCVRARIVIIRQQFNQRKRNKAKTVLHSKYQNFNTNGICCRFVLLDYKLHTNGNNTASKVLQGEPLIRPKQATKQRAWSPYVNNGGYVS
jgi:hypothetical protein